MSGETNFIMKDNARLLYNLDYWQSAPLDRELIENAIELSNKFWQDKDESIKFARAICADFVLERLRLFIAMDESKEDVEVFTLSYYAVLLLAYRTRKFDVILKEFELQKDVPKEKSIIKYFERFYYAESLFNLEGGDSAIEIFKELNGKVRPSHQRVIDMRLGAGNQYSLGSILDPSAILLRDSELQSMDKAALFEFLNKNMAERGLLHDSVSNMISRTAELLTVILNDFHIFGSIGTLSASLRDVELTFKPEVEVIFVGGFGWSGSGALADYLSGFTNVINPFSEAEPIWIQGRGDIYGLTHLVFDDFTKENFSKFFFSSLLGISYASEEKKHLDHNFISHRSMLGMSGVQGLLPEDILRVINSFLKSLIDLRTPTEILGSTLSLFNNWCGLHANEAGFMLLNNALLGSAFKISPLFKSSRFFYVKRNPLDMYSSRKIESERFKKTLTPTIFMKGYLKQRSEFLGLLDEYKKVLSCVQLIDFESLVTDPITSKNVLHSLGGESKLGAFQGAYLPINSAHNIGVFKNYPEQKEIEELRELLRECF